MLNIKILIFYNTYLIEKKRGLLFNNSLFLSNLIDLGQRVKKGQKKTNYKVSPYEERLNSFLVFKDDKKERIWKIVSFI